MPKADRTVRLCGDYKVSLNPALEVDKYPLPNLEDMLASLADGSVFSKLDLSTAYLQLEVSPESKPLLTINTHRGLYQYQRLNYGVASAPAIFQETMDKILHGLEKVCSDILISSNSKEEHLILLKEVLRRLEVHGIKIRRRKCEFLKPSITYLGYCIDKDGIHPTEDKVKAINGAPCPQDATELIAWLGLLNYYGRFIKDLSSILHPLNNLLQKDVPFQWTQECDIAFNECKLAISGDQVLVHYDVKKPIQLACDASPYGAGAVISHIMLDGTERPVAFASRTLTKAEKGYAQLEREALSLIFGVKKFHKYLYGWEFTLLTDHRPLQTIFGKKTGVPTLAAAQLQCWSLILSAYHYEIKHRKGSEHSNADAMSRLPCNEPSQPLEQSIFHVTTVDDLPISSKEIREATQSDPTLSRVLDYTLNGWPDKSSDENLKPYYYRRVELSIENDCILWGARVVIPPRFCKQLLNELHLEHQGITRKKAFARSSLWWPKLDSDIESLISSCLVCKAVQPEPPKAPLHPWSYATRPWERIHIDYAEKKGRYYLIVVDSYSKWLEVFSMNSMTARKTIERLRSLFARYRLPEILVSDNGGQFTSEEFSKFLKKNGIRHRKIPPYHAATNGQAEHYVQTLKQRLTKHMLEDNKLSEEHCLANFLLCYHTTPNSTTGQSPAELMMK